MAFQAAFFKNAQIEKRYQEAVKTSSLGTVGTSQNDSEEVGGFRERMQEG